MLHISHLKLKNFKSFKALNVDVPPSFICFAGPNGAGKSNILDAVRFILGETSLKSLRARKVRDLIHVGSKAAEGAITLDGESKYEIKRIIREDGKVIYRMNGKRTTRTSIMEALRRYNLDGSGRNIIAQGEVQKIVNMSGKERRGIIDAVAGVSDFEEKKKESIRDLDVVETRIKEASIVLGERKAFLEELGKEKEIAVKYSEKRDLLNNSKGTLLKLEMERFGKEKDGFDNSEKKLRGEKEKADAGYDEIQKKISETDAKRMDLSKELQGKQKTSETIRKIEELKASLGSKLQLIKEREEGIKKAAEEQKELKKQVSDEKKEMESLGKEVEKLGRELKSLESDASKQKAGKELDKPSPLKKKVDDAEERL